MAAGDSKGGSDLDVFEGLGKKNATRAPNSAPRTSAPPPPPSMRPADPHKGPPPPPPSLRQPDPSRAAPPPPLPPPAVPVGTAPPSFNKTIPLPAGVNATPAPSAPANAFAPTVPQPAAQMPPQAATLPSAGSSPRTPPPPPGRGALPPVVPPPSKTPTATNSAPAASAPGMSVKSLSTPPPAMPAPAAARSHGTGALDMDWDEEEEATHVLDREASKDAFLPPTGAGRGAPGPSAKQTLVGLAGSVAAASAAPPPGARPPSLPPPPPSAAQPYARPPAPPGTQNMMPSSAPPASIRPAAPPPPAVAPPPIQAAPSTNGSAAAFPYQQNTSPMAMPPRAGSRPAIEEAAPALPVPAFSRSRMEQTAILEPQKRPVGLFVGAGVGIAALIGTVMYLMPHTGSIDVNVADTKGGAVRNLRVSVDGKFQCESAPCQIQNIGSGSHTIKVEATGYEQPADKAVAVESGRVATIDFTLTAVAPSGGTGIKVAGSQPGEKLYVDDREIGALPQELHDLKPGTHKVRVSAGDRYAAVEKTVTVGENEFQDLGSVTLKVIKGRATVTLATPGAKVFLVSGSDRRELPTLPMSIDLEPSKQYSLVATKTGYSDFTLPLSFEDGQAEKSFQVTLEPKTASPSAGAISFSPPPQTYTPPSNPQPPRQPREPAPHESATAGGEGTLNMNSIPAASVVLDGKPIGSTPLTGITVSAGAHTVLFVNVDQNFKKQVSVTVAAGETKKVHP